MEEYISNKKMLKSKKSLTILFMTVGAVLAGVIIFIALILPNFQVSKIPWSVIYLRTGEIYIGKIIAFPKFQVFEAYQLQVTQVPVEQNKEAVEGQEQTTTPNIRLTPVKEALWAPKKLYFNENQIMFYGPIEETSAIAKAILGKGE